MRTGSTRSNLKTHKDDPSLMNASHKRNFKLVVGTQPTGILASNNTEAGKRVSTTESLLLSKSQTIFQSQLIRRYVSINSRSTKNDLFIQGITNDDILAKNIRRELNRTIRYSIFQQCSNPASFNELLDFSGSSLQATYDHLLIRASYRQFD